MEEYQFLIPILAFAAVMLVGGGIILLLQSNHRRVTKRLQEEGVVQSGVLPGVNAGGSGQSADVLAKLGQAVSSEGSSSRTRMDIIRAGYYEPHAYAVFMGIKMIMLLFGVALAVAVFMPLDMENNQIKYTLMGTVTCAFLFAPNMILSSQAKKRTADIRRHLPDAVDLMQVCLTGGMGLDMAWNSAADEVRMVSGLLSDEMMLTNLEMQLGVSRAAAMENLATRTGVDDVSSLKATLVQAEQFGTSIAESLTVFAENLREIKQQRAEEEAEKMPVKMLFPMVLFIFPVMFIVTLGPACITIYDKIINTG